MPKYSVITITHNGIKHTVNFIENLFRNTKDFELIIIDNNSTDGTVEYLQSLLVKENVTVIFNKTNSTYSKANNQGIKIASGEYIVFMNNDTIPSFDWADRMSSHFNKVPMKNIGMIGPVTSMSNGKQMVGDQDPEVWHAEHYGQWKNAGHLFGWCLMVKSEVLLVLGGFEESLTNAYDDNEICLRAKLAGYSLIIAYDTYVRHIGQGTFTTNHSTKMYLDNGVTNRDRFFDMYAGPEKKKLVAVYRTNNGEHLFKSLEQTSKFADSIIIHFCRAPQRFGDQSELNRDEYVKALKVSFPKIIKVGFYDGAFQEDYERNWLLQEALKLQFDGDADWCISLDDDEIYEDKFIGMVQRLMSPRNPEVMGYWCNWRTIWDKRLGQEYFRADSTFGGFANYRFFRLVQGQEILSAHHPEGHHCGSAPVIADENLRWMNVRVKHLGYDSPEQRQKKYEFYEANDHFKSKADIGFEDYSHLIDINVNLKKYENDNGISCVMMVKNEEEYLLGCLENIQPAVDEFIIVDTGSTDSTIDIIEKFAKHSLVPVKLLRFPWCDNYSLPRNYGKKHATRPWILFMDADERFEDHAVRQVYQATEGDADVVILNVLNYMESVQRGKNPKIATTRAARLFRNIPEFYLTGIIHESLDDAMAAYSRGHKLKVVDAPFALHHYGYLKKKEVVESKMVYYEKLNNDQIKVTDGMDPRPYFNLALHYLQWERPTDALKAFQKTLELNPRFWLASQQMAALNMNNAKTFLARTLESMPAHHPARKQSEHLFTFLNDNTMGFQRR